MRTWTVWLMLGAALPASAADGMRGPVSGFVVDGRSIRAIEGLPGAARLGASLQLPFSVSAAAIAVRQDYALATRSDGVGGPVLVRGLRAETPDVLEIDNAIEASSVTIAPSGTVALLHSPTRRQLQFVTGLPAAPHALEPVDLSGIESIAVVAVDSDGARAILGAADGQIYVAGQGTAPRAVATLRGVSSLAVLPEKDAAVASSVETGDLILLEGLAGTPSIRTLGGIANGLGPARAVRALDSRTVGVIAADGKLAALDIESGSVEWIALAGIAENFVPLDRNLFVLNRAGDQPLLLLDSSRGHSAWFVPPDRRPVQPRRPGQGGSGAAARPQ